MRNKKAPNEGGFWCGAGGNRIPQELSFATPAWTLEN